MKKTLALILALMLMLCSVSALAARERDAYTWAKALPEGAKFMFDYSRMQPVQAVKLARQYLVKDAETGAITAVDVELPDLVTTSGDKKVVVDKQYPNNAQVVVDANGNPVMADFAHMSKAEIAYWNDRLNGVEYGYYYIGSDGKLYIDNTPAAGAPNGTGVEVNYPVRFDGTNDDQASDHEYNDYYEIVGSGRKEQEVPVGVETLQPGATTTFVDPINGQKIVLERDIVEATFTEVDKTKSTPNGLGVEYTYSTTAPDSRAWSAAEKSSLVYDGQFEDATGQIIYRYVNKEVSNTPAANVATTTNRTENYISTAFAAGFLLSEINPDATSTQTRNVIPVDLTQEGTFVYPIVTKAHTIVGLVWATVADGTLTIDGQLRDQVKRYGDDFTLKIYTSVEQLAKKGTAYEIGEEIAISELGDAIFFEISGKVQYHWSIGASKVTQNGVVYGVYWTLQDYWRYETTWKLYRNSLRDVADLVAAEAAK